MLYALFTLLFTNKSKSLENNDQHEFLCRAVIKEDKRFAGLALTTQRLFLVRDTQFTCHPLSLLFVEGNGNGSGI